MVCFCCYPAGNGHISHQTGKGKSFDSKVPLAGAMFPSKIDWDLTNGPLSKLLEPLDTQVEGSVQWVLLEISWNHIHYNDACTYFLRSYVHTYQPKTYKWFLHLYIFWWLASRVTFECSWGPYQTQASPGLWIIMEKILEIPIASTFDAWVSSTTTKQKSQKTLGNFRSLPPFLFGGSGLFVCPGQPKTHGMSLAGAGAALAACGACGQATQRVL